MMTDPITRELLLFLLHNDASLLQRLCDEQVLPTDLAVCTREHAETARVVGTLVHELEVDWPGVEIVLHLRTQLVSAHKQVAELVWLLEEERRGRRGGDG